MTKVDDSFRKMAEGYGQTTVQIFYRRPSASIIILGEFVWQLYDLYPEFPRLRGFLDFWNTSLMMAPIQQVLVSHQRLIKPAEFNIVNNEFTFQ